MTSFQISESVLKHWLEQLNTNELEGFQTLIEHILSKRKKVDKIREEKELLKKINQQVEEKVLLRLKELRAKQTTSVLTETEYEELLQLIEKIENFDAQRIIYLGQLAQLKNIPIFELMKTLKIYPKVNGEIIYS